MATAAENLATAQTNLAEQMANITARLVELDAVSLDERAKMTYSIGVRNYDWNGYRASLSSQLDNVAARMESLAKTAQIIAGPFTVIGRAGVTNG